MRLLCGSINVRERPWASKRQPIDYKRCCTDRLNAQGSSRRHNTMAPCPLMTLNGHQRPLIKPPGQSVSLLHVGRVPIILEALHTVHVGRVPIILEVLHRLDIQPRGRALHHVELVAVSEDYSARPDFLGPEPCNLSRWFALRIAPCDLERLPIYEDALVVGQFSNHVALRLGGRKSLAADDEPGGNGGQPGHQGT